MDRLYRYSPIKTKEELFDAINYVARKAIKLCKKITDREYPISSITVFSHYHDEFEKLKKILLGMGELKRENNGPFVKFSKPIELTNSKLELVRVRKPDPYRMQVGCCDFEIPDYEKFKTLTLPDYPESLRLIKRPDYEMIEFFDPDFDVLAYVLSKPLI